jgi:4'-phosphopantetheinyl transferase
MLSASSDQLDGVSRVLYARPEVILASADRAALLACLSQDERERYARFHFDEDRDIYLVAHALTRRLLAATAHVEAAELRFRATEHGRPEIAGPEPALALRFNLTHTRGLVACGVTRDSDIGVDAERVDRHVQLLGVGRHVFSKREMAGLEALQGEDQRQRFFDLWTLKEAYVKATGKGLGSPLRAITFLPSAVDPVPVHFDPEVSDDPADWCFRRHVPSPNLRLAAALRAGCRAEISFREIDSAELLDTCALTA